MINTCKSNPCCGNFRDCTEPLPLPAQPMTPTDNLEAGAGDLVERLRALLDEEAADHADDAADAIERGERPDLWDREITLPVALLREAAAQLAAVTAENVRLRERIEQAYKAGFDFAMLTEAPK